jgi:exopolysaccharide biosynthesis polyprenyl glycosylphosphotransferase
VGRRVEISRRRDGDLLQPALFLLSDLVALELAFLLTYYVRFSTGWMASPLGVPPFATYLYGSLVMLPVFLGIFYANGLYDPARRKSIEEDFAGLLRSVVYGSMVVLALAFFVRQSSFSRTFFVLFFASSLCFLFSGRVLMRAVLRRNLRRGVGVTRALLLGDSPMRERLLETFHSLPGLGIVPVGLVVQYASPQPDPVDPGSGLPILGGIADLERVIVEHDVDAVLLTLPFEGLSLVTEIAERLGPYHVDVQFVPDMQRIRASRMRLKEIAGVPFISVREGGLSGIDRIVKRTVDVCVSGVGLLLLSPILLILALSIKLSSKGPVLYRQERLGRDHRPFQMLKFRTMRPGAERDSGPVITIQNDPRRTGFGSFLRRFSLDELPQLWNVLRGDMSLVGPRPERAHFAEQFHELIPRYLERHRVRSGLTGWAQVHGLRGNTPVELRTLYDLHYVENWSLGLDLRILLRTLLHVLRGENAY